MAVNYDLNNTGPEVQERLDQVPVTQEQLQAALERIDALERKMEHYHPESVAIDVSPNSVYIGQQATVTVDVSTTSPASSIKLYRGEVEIYHAEDSSGFQYQDTIEPETDDNVVYCVVAVIDGTEKHNNASVVVSQDVLKRIEWTGGSITPDILQVDQTALLTKGTVTAVYESGATEVVTDSAVFGAQRGTINGTTYTAPSTDGNDTISVSYGGKTAGNTLSVTVELGIKDYYVGWATGDNASFDGFAALSDAQIAALATGYSKRSTPSITKTVTAAEATGTRQIFFLMWKQGSAPVSGSVTSGGITDTFSTADFVNTDVFRATHNDVTIDGTSYHVAGLRGAFDANDVFVVNF